MKKIKRKLRRIAALVLTSVLVGSSIPVSGLSETDAVSEKTGKITAFAELSSDILTQTLAIGSAESEITLPDSLTVTLELPAETSPVQDPEPTGPENTAKDGAEAGDQSEAPPDNGNTSQPQATPEASQTDGSTSDPQTTPEASQSDGNVTDSQAQPETPAADSSPAEPQAHSENGQEDGMKAAAEPENLMEEGSETDIQTSFLDVVLPAATVHAAEITDTPQTETVNFTLTGITWELDAAASAGGTFSSDASAAGSSYTYVPVLPETAVLTDGASCTLTVGEGAELPRITVTIDQQGENDVARVTAGNKISYYENPTDAFSAACAAEGGATITLLKDCSTAPIIEVSGGQITLDLNGYTLSNYANQYGDPGGDSYYNTILRLTNCQMTLLDSSSQTGSITNALGNAINIREGASLIMESGYAKSEGDSGIFVTGDGSLTVHGGSITGTIGVLAYRNASVSITNGTLQGASTYALSLYYSTVKAALSGGAYLGGIYSMNAFSSILGDGLLYYNETDKCYITESLNQGGQLAGRASISIRSIPVKSVSAPSDLELTYGYSSNDAVLSVQAELSGDAAEVFYQWYRVGAGAEGTDQMLSDSEGGYSGSTSASLTLPTGLRGGETGQYYCVVDCSGYKVQSAAASVTVTECAHDNLINGTCQNCGKTFYASVTANDRKIFWETLGEAWADAKERGSAQTPAELTLLQNVALGEALTVEEGNAIILSSAQGENGETYTLSGNVNVSNGGLITITGGTLTLTSGTVSQGSGGSNAVGVSGGVFVMTGGTVETASSGNSAVCVYDTGTAQIDEGSTIRAVSAKGSYGVAAVEGGKAIINGGSIYEEQLEGILSDAAAVYARGGGSVEIHGGTITGESIALKLDKGCGALLSGGTYSSGVFTISSSTYNMDQILAEYCDYYTPEGEKAERFVGNQVITGTVIVKRCVHEFGDWTDAGDEATHSRKCSICGCVETEDHSGTGWKDNGDGETHTGTCTVCGGSVTQAHIWDENRICTVCGAEATGTIVASVTVSGKITYYGDLATAWDEAKTQSAGGTSATVTLLSDVTASKSLTVSEGESIILESAASENGPYTISGSFSNQGIIRVLGGSFTMNSGKICVLSGYAYGIEVSSGTAILNSGEISANADRFGRGLLVRGGSVEIKNGCTIQAWVGVVVDNGDVQISGGTISGTSAGISASIASGYDNGSLIISGGDISGEVGLSLTGFPSVAVTGGTITGSRIGLQVNDTNYGTVLTISNGYIKGEQYGLYISLSRIASSSICLTGGMYTGGEASISGDGSQTLLLQIIKNDSSLSYAEYQYYAVDNSGKATEISRDAISYGSTLSASDGYGTVIVKSDYHEMISVSMEWGSMSFAYGDSYWNPNTLRYEAGTWHSVDASGNSDDDGGRILITNDSSVPVEVSYTFTKDTAENGLAEVTGSFSSTDQSGSAGSSGAGESEGSSLLEEYWSANNTADIYFSLSGAPTGTFTGAALGTITVTIGKAG
ncbi:MAG: hypothetical protein Q4C91_12045 [Eubacteriales bacterium]|nr:hypothetical protein [Eubacteriales bacterium]